MHILRPEPTDYIADIRTTFAHARTAVWAPNTYDHAPITRELENLMDQLADLERAIVAEVERSINAK